MTRTVKKIAHDLSPLSDVVSELSTLISELLTSINNHISFEDSNISSYFSECLQATQKLAISAQLIKHYIKDMNDEAASEQAQQPREKQCL